jgi:hypothetical protein
MEGRLAYLPESLNFCTDRVTLSQLETIYKLECDPHFTTPSDRSLSSIFRNLSSH